MTPLLGGIEAGGTKFVCAVGRGPDELIAESRIPTTAPGETIGRTVDFLRRAAGGEALAAVGIGSFGPIDPHPGSATFGHITSTPKPGWAQTDLAGAVARALGVPVGFDTDVNAAALGEYRWGAARGLDCFVYLTVGTGIGGGAMVGGRPVHGLLHPEMGHLLIPRRDDDDFAGVCPFHGACFEGLASGPALERRWGRPAEELPDDHPAWELEAHYLALGLANIVCVISPRRIILGGGVASRPRLLAAVRRRLRAVLSGYIEVAAITEDNDRFLVPPALGHRSGVLGAIALAAAALGITPTGEGAAGSAGAAG
jgi:fructokinase